MNKQSELSNVFSQPISPQGITISQDGKQVALIYMRDEIPYLGIFDVEKGKPILENELACGRPGGLTWSPDGSLLAFFASAENVTASHIFTADPSTENRQKLDPAN